MFLFGAMAVVMSVVLPLCVFFTTADVNLITSALNSEVSHTLSIDTTHVDSDSSSTEEPTETPEEPAETPEEPAETPEGPTDPEPEEPADSDPITDPDTEPEPEPEPEEPTLEEASLISFAVLTDMQGDTAASGLLQNDDLKDKAATLFLGDLIEDDDDNSAALSTYNWLKSRYISTVNTNTIYVLGNHDNNTHYGKGYIQKSDLAGEDGKTYGYIDYDEARLRLIYIDTSDYEMFHGTGITGNYDFDWNNTPYISLNQLNDIAGYLSSTPENYSVFIVGHYPTLGAGAWVNEYNGEYYGFSIKPLISLIRAYNSHTACRITYSDYSVTDYFYWWMGDDAKLNSYNLPAARLNAHIVTATSGMSGNGKLHGENVSVYDEQGYIDVDFTANTTNKIIAYGHGHTHNFSSTIAHRILDETEAVNDFVEVGFAALSTTGGKGSTDWGDGQSARWNYTSEMGCSDYYAIKGNKDLTAGAHASVLTINTNNMTIFIDNVSSYGTGFGRYAVCDLSSADYSIWKYN